jgi:hypothetical protein
VSAMRLDRAALGAAAAVAVAAAFFFSASRDLDSPAPNYQEAYHVLPAQQLLRGRGLHRDLWISLGLGSGSLILSNNEYTGAWIENWSLRPLFAAGRVSVTDWRLLTLAMSLCAWLVYAQLAKDLFGGRAALLALVLLCFQSVLFYYARTGLDSEASSLWLLSAVFWLCAARWQAGGTPVWARAAAFVLGVGIYEKIQFLWIIMSFALAYAAVYRGDARRRLPPLPSCALFFAAGIAPLVVMNIVSPWCTVLFVLRGLLHPADGSGTLRFVPHFAERIRQFGGYAFTEHLLGRRLTAWAVAGKAIPLAAAAAALRPSVARRLPRFSYVLLASVPAYLAASCVYGTGLSDYHMLVVLPPFLIFAAGALDALLPRWPAFLAAAALALLPDRAAWAAFTADFQRSGGEGPLSLALYDLRDYCLRRGIFEPVSLRAAAVETLEAVSGGLVVPFDASRPAPGIDDAWRSLLADPKRRFIATSSEFFDVPPYARELDFERWAGERGYALAVENTFANRAGQTMYSLCYLKRVRRGAAAAAVKSGGRVN